MENTFGRQMPHQPWATNQTPLNGNYQQNLATGVSGMNLNAPKTQPPMQPVPQSVPQPNINGQNNNSMTNNNVISGNFINGQYLPPSNAGKLNISPVSENTAVSAQQKPTQSYPDRASAFTSQAHSIHGSGVAQIQQPRNSQIGQSPYSGITNLGGNINNAISTSVNQSGTQGYNTQIMSSIPQMQKTPGVLPPQNISQVGIPPSAMTPSSGIQSQPGFPSSQQIQTIPPQSLFPQPGQLSQGNIQQPGYPPIHGFPSQPGVPPHAGIPSQQGVSAPHISMQQSGLPPHPGYNAQQLYQQTQPSGLPPQLGRNVAQQATGGYNTMGVQYPQAAAPQRRLDPDQMPNPIQVMVENQNYAGGQFITNQPGLVPPLVTTKYVTQDQGYSGPRFLRSSLYSVPATADMLKNTAVPFTLIISPLAKVIQGEIEPPIVNFGDLGPIRCIRCKAYISPNMQFVDGGRRFQCLLCKATTEVPSEYFQHLDHNGQRIDKYERPELVLGTYEFIATKDYCRDNTPPNPPAFIFIIDVSYNNIKSGLVNLLCQEMKEIIKHFPIDNGQERSKMRVGFITYNSTVHFYNIKDTLAQPQMMVVGDTQEMFMPLLDGFLCDPEESAAVIDALMEQIPKMFGETRETETILLPAIQAGLEALKASSCAGKLLVFNSSLPIAEAPGKLKNRDDRKVLGTEKEKTMLAPQCMSYNNLGQDCVQAGCSVDIFAFNNSYIDLATIGQVSRLTGGEVYKYTYFQADIDGSRLIKDVIQNVSRQIAFDAVLRVRTSTGVRTTDFYGHFFMSNTTDMEIASIDSNKAVAIEIKHDDKLSPEENVYIQVALLYTSSGGQRRLRIMNQALRTSTQMADIFKSCDLDAAILFFAKQSMFKLMELTPKAVKDNLIHRAAQLLACYRKNCTSPTSAGQLILPECMKLLPLYISCLMKNDALSGGSDMTCDDRSYVMQYVLSMDLPMSVSYFYPRLIPLHDVNVNDTDIPLPIRCTYEKMNENGAYILENGIHMFIWLGLGLSTEIVQQLFGVQCTAQVDTGKLSLPQMETPLSKRIRQIVEKIQQERTRCMRVTLVKQRDKLESVFRHFLVEDRGTDGSPSYVDFLCHMHKEIKEILS